MLLGSTISICVCVCRKENLQCWYVHACDVWLPLLRSTALCVCLCVGKNIRRSGECDVRVYCCTTKSLSVFLCVCVDKSLWTNGVCTCVLYPRVFWHWQRCLNMRVCVCIARRFWQTGNFCFYCVLFCMGIDSLCIWVYVGAKSQKLGKFMALLSERVHWHAILCLNVCVCVCR